MQDCKRQPLRAPQPPVPEQGDHEWAVRMCDAHSETETNQDEKTIGVAAMPNKTVPAKPSAARNVAKNPSFRQMHVIKLMDVVRKCTIRGGGAKLY